MAELQERLQAICASQRGVVQDYQPEWEAVRFFVGGKMFAMFGCNKEGRPVMTLKCDPAEAMALRAQYPDVLPGYYMNKAHWNSVRLDGHVPLDAMGWMIRESHRLVLATLPQKRQRQILSDDEAES